MEAKMANTHTPESELRWLLDLNERLGLDLDLPQLCRLYEHYAEHFKPRWRWSTARELMAAARAGVEV
jgi:hypothetical protein